MGDPTSTQTFSPGNTRRQRMNEGRNRRVQQHQQENRDTTSLDLISVSEGYDELLPPVGDSGPGFRLLFLKFVWEQCERKKRDLNINHNPALQAEVYRHLKKLPNDIEDIDAISNVSVTQVEFNHIEHLISDLERELKRVKLYKSNIK